MGDPSSRPSSPSRSRWLRYPAVALALLAVAYLVLTSAPAVRSLVLPRVAEALQSDVSVGDLSLSPFSSLTLRDLKVTPRGGETLLTASLVRVRYSLMDILRGRISVNEVLVETPVVTVVTGPDGTSNLSRITAGRPTPPETKNPPKAEPVALNLRNLSVKNGTVRLTQPAGRSAEITGLNVTVDALVTGQPGTLTLGSAFRLTESATNQLAGTVQSEFKVRLNETLVLREINGALKVAMTGAGGAWSNYGRLGLNLTADSTESEIRQVRLEVTDSGKSAGEIRLSGPFDPDKKEAQIAYEVRGIGPSALGIAGAVMGVDFGATRIEADGRVNMERAGKGLGWQGRFSADPLSVATSSGRTPPLAFLAEFRMRADLEASSAVLERADVTLRQGGTPVVQGALDRPMNFSWDAAAKGTRESTYSLAVKNLDLASWRSWFGPDFPEGRASLDTKITSERDGRLLQVKVSGGVTDLSVPVGQGRVSGLGVRFQSAGNLQDFKVLLVESLGAEVQRSGERLVQVSGLAQGNLRNGEFTGQLSGDAALPALLRASPVDGVVLTSGKGGLDVRIGSRNGQTNASVSLVAGALTGEVHSVALKEYEAKLEMNGSLGRNKVQLQRATLSLRSGLNPPGTLEATGGFEPESRRGEFTFKSANLNETVLAPWVAGSLAPRRLESVGLELSGGSQVDLGGASSLTASLQVNRLVVRNAQDRSAPSPLAFGAVLEASGRGSEFDLKKLSLVLPKTERARNELLAVGKLQVATNRFVSGQFTVTSPGLDFTPLAGLMDSGTGTPAPAPEKPRTPASEPGTPIHLPVGRLSVDSKLDAVYFREVAVTNWISRVEIHQDRVTVNPFNLGLNGAPVSLSADLDLGVPGYVYDLKGRLPGVPVSPLAKTFLTGEQADLGGTLDASLDLKGAGVSGRALKEHLAGTAAFSATNLNYRITALKTPLMRTLVQTLTTALQLPAISDSPIGLVEARLSAKQGVVTLASSRVASTAFQASAKGEVRLADALTNSAIALPVTVSLPKTNAWEELPTFLTIRGTLGSPKPEVDPIALARTLTRIPGAVGDLGIRGAEKLGGAIDRALGGKSATNGGVGTSLIQGLLGGKPADTNAAAGTSGKSTNAPAPLNPLDLFKKKPAPPK